LAKDLRRTVVLVSLEGDLGKGSVRSVENLAFLDALLQCGNLLEDVGGHQMAAGITVKEGRLNDFREAFERALASQTDTVDLASPPLLLDGWLRSPEELTNQTMLEIEQMAPFGQGNPEPVVGMRQMRIMNKRVVGGEHLKLTLGRDGKCFEAIGFEMGHVGVIESDHPCWDVVFTPRREYWNGQDRLSLRIHDLQPS
jgi:single-stranded-DNA-specific exonuclease